MNHKPKILSQGSFDGACLLYALMNAYKSFKGKSISSSVFAEEEKEVWKQVVNEVNSPKEIFNGNGSSSCFGENEVESTYRFVKKVVNMFEFDQILKVKRILIKELLNIDFSNSIAILCYNENGNIKSSLNGTEISDHWVCAIGFKQKSICVQCSFTSQLSTSYRECKHDKSGRYYNQKISIKQINPVNIAHEYIYLISRKNRL